MSVMHNEAGAPGTWATYSSLSGQTTTRRSPEPLVSDGERTPLLAMPESWSSLSKCLDSGRADDNAAWRADKDPYDQDYRTQKDGAEIAERLCAGCPVMAECLADTMAREGNLSARNRYGVRGGLTPDGRAELVVAERECRRGHVGHFRPYRHKSRNSDEWRCSECVREDQAAARVLVTSCDSHPEKDWARDAAGRFYCKGCRREKILEHRDKLEEAKREKKAA